MAGFRRSQGVPFTRTCLTPRVCSPPQACCLQLKAKISRAQSAKEQESRKRNLTRYIPDVTSSIIKVRPGVCRETHDRKDTVNVSGQESIVQV